MEEFFDLIIGDIHLDGRDSKVLKAQVDTILKICKTICETYKINDIIFLGDIFNYRKPSPSELVSFHNLLHRIKLDNSFSEIIVLRGNHDTETKDGSNLTALSIFNNEFVSIKDNISKYGFYIYIPHFEDENIILEELKRVNPIDTILGHFGVKGSLNSRGDEDFNIIAEEVKTEAILGHIHHHKQLGSVTLLGTPYTTNFGESGKDSYVMLYSPQTKKKKFIPVNFGIRHLIVNLEDLEDNLDFINDPNFYTLLKINISNPIVLDSFSEILNNLNVINYFINFEPKIDPEEVISLDVKDVKEISNNLIEEYIKASNASLDTSTLLVGLEEIYANKQNKNQ